jgi:hypothetical protein
MDELARTVLIAVVAASDARVDDVRAAAFAQLIETLPTLTADRFAAELDRLCTDGYLTTARPKRDMSGSVVRERYLLPTSKGRIEVRR